MMLGIMMLSIGVLIFLTAVYCLYGHEGVIAFILFASVVGFVTAGLVLMAGGMPQ